MYISAIACDVDFTLSHFVGKGMSGLYEIFVSFGIEQELIQKVVANITEGKGFTVEVVRKELEKVTGITLPKKVIKTAFASWLQETLQLYDDVPRFLSEIRRCHLDMHLVTYGESAYQRQKIRTMGIQCAGIVVVGPTGEAGTKVEVIQELLELYGGQILYIEDKGLELDSIRNAGIGDEEVCTVLVKRTDSPYFSIQTKHAHFEVDCLQEVLQLIQTTNRRII